MRRKQDLVSCDPGNKDVVTYDQYDLFYPNDLGDPTNSPSVLVSIIPCFSDKGTKQGRGPYKPRPANCVLR